ncbi:MAG: hypothetical protein U5L96_15360 [Owenweeksia sp.]|nr:hypothetical protein [Owenweeksia sp.]
MFRAGYTAFNNGVDGESTTVFTGFAAGLSVDVPMGENKFQVDYAFQPTKRFDGVAPLVWALGYSS